MNLETFTGPGSTPSRRRFWDKVTQAVIASQKIAGRFVTVDEHLGKGTVINVADTSARRRPPSGGCPDPMCPRTVAVDSIVMDCGCIDLSLIGSSGSVEFSAFSNAGSPYTTGGSEPCIANPSVSCHVKVWSSSDCSGSPAESDSTQVLIVSCFNDKIEVMILGSDITTELLVSFYNDNVTLGVAASNLATCGSVITGTSLGNVLGVAHGGTVTVT